MTLDPMLSAHLALSLTHRSTDWLASVKAGALCKAYRLPFEVVDQLIRDECARRSDVRESAL